MKYSIPSPPKGPNSILFRTILVDWLDANPEDEFCSEDPDVTYLLHDMFPSHLCESSDTVWSGFWEGFLPEPGTDDPETDTIIYLDVVNGKAVLDERVIGILLERLKQGLSVPTLAGSTPHA